jgi:hypothetical protein
MSRKTTVKANGSKPVRVAVVVWMKPSLKAKLKAVAKKEEKSLSSVIREILAGGVT